MKSTQEIERRAREIEKLIRAAMITEISQLLIGYSRRKIAYKAARKLELVVNVSKDLVGRGTGYTLRQSAWDSKSKSMANTYIISEEIIKEVIYQIRQKETDKTLKKYKIDPIKIEKPSQEDMDWALEVLENSDLDLEGFNLGKQLFVISYSCKVPAQAYVGKYFKSREEAEDFAKKQMQNDCRDILTEFEEIDPDYDCIVNSDKRTQVSGFNLTRVEEG